MRLVKNRIQYSNFPLDNDVFARNVSVTEYYVVKNTLFAQLF